MILAVANKLRSDPTRAPITSFLLDLLTLVLYNMNFEFNGEHFLQIGGTAVGISLAPNYTNLFMDRFGTHVKQSDLLDMKAKEPIDTPVMVTTYNPKNPLIKSLIRDNWNIIQNTDDLKKTFKDQPLSGYRRLP